MLHFCHRRNSIPILVGLTGIEKSLSIPILVATDIEIYVIYYNAVTVSLSIPILSGISIEKLIIFTILLQRHFLYLIDFNRYKRLL